MKNSNVFLNLPVMSMTEGSIVAKTDKFLIDAAKKKAVAVLIHDADYYKGAKLIPVAQILGIGKDALMIKTSKNIVPYVNIDSSEDLLREEVNIIGTKVIDVNGENKGIISDFYLDDNYNIVKLTAKTSNNENFDIDIKYVDTLAKNYTMVNLNQETIDATETKFTEKKKLDIDNVIDNKYSALIGLTLSKEFKANGVSYPVDTALTKEMLSKLNADDLIRLSNCI